MSGREQAKRPFFPASSSIIIMLLLLIALALSLAMVIELLNRKTAESPLPSFNGIDEDLGWYYGTKDSKKPGTPDNWILLWADPERMAYYRNHKLVRLGEEFIILNDEPVMILEEPLLDRNKMENNLAIRNVFGPIEEIVLEDEGKGKRAFVVSVRLKLRFGKETTFVELGTKSVQSGGTTDFKIESWQGYTVTLVSIETRPEARVVLKVEKSGIVHG